jgi:DNA-binding transcriptional MerR regulator
MMRAAMKVGALAKQTGLSVRTLHYYDEIGLLSPSQRTASGHRLYTADDIARLQQITSLRQLGFSLEEIRDCINRPTFSPQRVIKLHLARLEEQIELERKLCHRLRWMASRLSADGEISVEEFIQTIEATSMLEKYFTPVQMAELKERSQMLGEGKICRAENEWPQLIARVRAEMEKGTDPGSETVQQLAKRWMELVDEFTGGNPEIAQAVKTMYREEAALARENGLDRWLFDYIGQAIGAAKKR